MTHDLPIVSVVFVTYERLQTLEPTLCSFLSGTDYPRDRLELIVTDDGSSPQVVERIRTLGFDRVCVAPKRGGLGANVNRGVQAASGPYILQLQDDWECRGPPDYLRYAVGVLELRPEIGMLILNEHPEELVVRERAVLLDRPLRVYDNRPAVTVGQVGEHAYTDWPHVKRRSFVDAIGPYLPDRRMWETELDYARRVNAQQRYFIADVEGLTVFKHIGDDFSYNKGPLKARIGRELAKSTYGRHLINVVRTIKRLRPDKSGV